MEIQRPSDAGAIIENVYKFCMEEKKSGMKLSLNRVWDRTAALLGVRRTYTQKNLEEMKKAQDEQQQPKQPPSSTSNVSQDDIDQGVVRRTIASMYSLNNVLPTLDYIRTELKQSIGYTGSKGRLRKDLLHMKFACTRCGLNQKVLMERQMQSLAGPDSFAWSGSRERRFTQSFIQMKLAFIPATLSRNAVKIVLLD